MRLGPREFEWLGAHQSPLRRRRCEISRYSRYSTKEHPEEEHRSCGRCSATQCSVHMGTGEVQRVIGGHDWVAESTAFFAAQTLHMASVLAASVLAASVLAASVAARAAAAADADAVLPTLLLLLLLPPLRVAPRLGPGAWGRRGPPHSTSNLFFLVFSCTRQRPAVLETQ